MRDLHNNIRDRYQAPGKESIHNDTFGIIDKMPTHPTKGWPGDKEKIDQNNINADISNEVNDLYDPEIVEIDIIEIDILPVDEIEGTENEHAPFCEV